MANRTFDNVGYYIVTFHIYDGENSVLIGYRLVYVIDKTPDYLMDDFKREHSDDEEPVIYDVVISSPIFE